MSIGDRLRSIRADVGLNQEAMAERVGMGAASWKRLELEDRAPKGEVLAELVAMGFDANWLLIGAGQMRRGAALALDRQLLQEALELVEDWLTANRRTMAPTKKAEVVAGIYEMAMEDVAEGKPLEARRVAQILKLVG